MGFIPATALGGGEALLVANHETEFKILTFLTYWKIAKLRDCQLETVEMKKFK
jgi:hypothetical protein